MSALDIPPLCSCKIVDENKECVECKIGWNTGIIDDENKLLDDSIVSFWMEQVVTNVIKVSPSLLKLSRDWFRQQKRKTIFIISYESLYHLKHASHLQLIPVDILKDFIQGELKEHKIMEKLEENHATHPFHPDEQFLLLIRVAYKLHETDEQKISKDEYLATNGIEQDEHDKVVKTEFSKDICRVITPAVLLPKLFPPKS